jgi:hypothetical protein
MGVGIHGEPGRRRVNLASADAIADQMVGAILADGDNLSSGDVLPDLTPVIPNRICRHRLWIWPNMPSGAATRAADGYRCLAAEPWP